MFHSNDDRKTNKITKQLFSIPVTSALSANNSRTFRKTEMQKILNSVPLIYNIVRSTTPMVHKASITTLKLNVQTIPKQPVPDLKMTAERYLRSLKPLLNINEYSKTEKIIQHFISDDGPGPYLHSKLLKRFENTDNWMSEWWLNVTYLGYRDPVIINSSPGIVGPKFQFNSQQDMYLVAARLIRAICNYNEIVKSGKMKQEMVRNEPLDMQPYGMILGTHRRPCRKIDRLIHTDHSKHIIVISNNNFFKLDIMPDSSILSESQLVAVIKDIVDRSRTKGKPIGILTGNDRDTWAEDYSLLLGLGNNKNIIKNIESSLFVLCLDKAIPKEAFNNKNNESARAIQSLAGYNSCVNASNRWHDKTVQYIISSDGFIGLQYEHSPCEGVPIAVLHDYVLKDISVKENNTKCDHSKNFPRAELLTFEINNTLESAIENATHTVDTLSDNTDMECFKFDEFGTDAIKKLRLSPDSFIQIALQVTYYKLHNKAVAHYESGTLRRFANSRTECIRSTTTESIEFAKVLTDGISQDKSQIKEMMINAINTHKNIVAEATTGNGIDRHLFGLKMIALDEGMELPELYKDVGYTRSTYYKITSSQVPFKSASFMCYGAVVPDGYGCCYNPRPKDIFFACSSFKSCISTDTKKFANTLQQTLCDMKKIGSI